MKKVNVEKFISFGPCYSRDKIRELAGDKKDWSALDILKLESVPADDRLWAVLREEFIDDRILRLFAVWCARQCNQTEPICIDAINTAERFANGEATEEELKDARSAAWSASWSAAGYAAWNAAWSATRYAACSAAGNAAGSAACSAARYAQVEHLIEMLEVEE